MDYDAVFCGRLRSNRDNGENCYLFPKKSGSPEIFCLSVCGRTYLFTCAFFKNASKLVRVNSRYCFIRPTTRRRQSLQSFLTDLCIVKTALL